MATIGEMQALYWRELSSIYEQREARTITRWIFEDALKVDNTRLSLERFRVLTTDELDVLYNYLHRLKRNEPVQYILGYTEFCNLRFKVSPEVLIPRAETEELVYLALAEIEKSKLTNPLRILDIGTGSGCIAIAIKFKLQDAIVDAIDISKAALALAAENASVNATEINFLECDILKEMPDKKYAVILSNPPYISFEEQAEIKANVINYEPHQALFSKDPLLYYRRFANIFNELLLPDGLVLVEVSEFRAQEVADVFHIKNFESKICNDLCGKQRMLLIRKHK